MKFNLSLLVSSAIAVGITAIAVAPGRAQSAPATHTAESGLDFKLSPQQLRAIAAVSDFALDQMENMVTHGFNPKKVDRVEVQRQSETMRQMLTSLQLSDQQKEVLRTILRSARQQIRRQIENP